MSEGCRSCYAELIAARFSGPGKPFAGFAIYDDRGPRWTGKVELVEKHLEDPLRWKKPRRIFVNSMSDLFHESLDGPTIARVFAVMARAPRHTFQVLTKRAAKMREVVSDPAFRAEVSALADNPNTSLAAPGPWPLPNVWLGVSVEHQEAADERIPELLATPAAVRFLSCEPLLGPVSFDGPRLEWLAPFRESTPSLERTSRIDWLIVGGESGRGARPAEIAWMRSLVEQAQAAGVAPFMKQLGTVLGGRDHHNIDTFPADLRVREFPRG